LGSPPPIFTSESIQLSTNFGVEALVNYSKPIKMQPAMTTIAVLTHWNAIAIIVVARDNMAHQVRLYFARILATEAVPAGLPYLFVNFFFRTDWKRF
jgi:hypothetical protein